MQIKLLLLLNEPGNCGEKIAVGHNNTEHFFAQSGTSILLTVWKWSGESQYPEALPPVLENFRRAFSPDLTDCPWVSEDI